MPDRDTDLIAFVLTSLALVILTNFWTFGGID